MVALVTGGLLRRRTPALVSTRARLRRLSSSARRARTGQGPIGPRLCGEDPASARTCAFGWCVGLLGRCPSLPPRSGWAESSRVQEDPRGLVLKYLAAFGPATVRDVQTWSGRMGLKQAVEEIRGELRVFRDEMTTSFSTSLTLRCPRRYRGPAHASSPGYDNLVLSHADRGRVISEEHRKKVFLSTSGSRSRRRTSPCKILLQIRSRTRPEDLRWAKR